jgi:hypothetical protein
MWVGKPEALATSVVCSSGLSKKATEALPSEALASYVAATLSPALATFRWMLLGTCSTAPRIDVWRMPSANVPLLYEALGTGAEAV